MAAQRVRHPGYGWGTIQTPVKNGYVTVLFGGARVVLPHTELELIPDFRVGDRVDKDGRQGTVKCADPVQVNVAWDDSTESYEPSISTDLTLLPPLPSGTPVKRKGTTHVGEIINTPSRGDAYVGVLWSSGHSSTVKLETMAPTSPQKPQDGKRTVDDALAEIKTEIDKWAKVGAEAEEKVRVLTEQATVLLNAKRHATLVQSIEKW